MPNEAAGHKTNGTPKGLIYGKSEMAALIRAFDWGLTSLGRVEGWSEPLLASVNLMLACAFPSLVFWGPDLVQLYNDRFIPLLAERHPKGLGQTAQECWLDAWQIVGPNLKRVMDLQETVYYENTVVPIIRDGKLQDIRWTYSYSPIFGSGGDVLGVLVICQDITREVNATQELKESEARASRVLQSIGDAVIVTDADARVTRMNAVAEQLTGWTIEQARGELFSRVFHIVDEATQLPVQSPAEKVKETGAVVGLANHTVLISKDGKSSAIDDSGAPIRDEKGDLTGVVVVFRDIQERRAAEREAQAVARAERERLRSLFMQAPAPILTMEGPNLIITLANEGYIKLLRRESASEVVGKTIREALPELEGQGFFELLDNVYLTGTPYVGHEMLATLENKITGELDEAWFNFIYQPARNADGEVDGILVVAIELTEQVRARKQAEIREKLLERQTSELETIYKTAPIGLALFDPVEFRYLRLNDTQARIIGLPPSEVLGKTVTEIAPIEGLHEMFQRVAEGKPIQNALLEGALPAQPDVHRHWTVNYFPVYAEDGTVQAITAASLEITAQRRAEEALIQTDKIAAVGRLASSIAHEINNPLESVTNLLYLARGSSEVAEIQRYLAEADRELRRVSLIASQTLRFYRQSTHQRAIRFNTLIESVLTLYQARLLNSNIQVEIRDRQIEPVVCFEGEIRQVLNNLVGNAIDAMPRGGRLLLRGRVATNWRSGERGVVFTSADTGSGIPHGIQKRIFEPFFTTKDINGTGLGLWISNELIEKHCGSIRLRSSQRPRESGTVFTLFIPFRRAIRPEADVINETYLGKPN